MSPKRPLIAEPDHEYALKGSNWVQQAVINQDCTESIRIMEKYVGVVPVPINQLAHGGVACATVRMRPWNLIASASQSW